MLDTGMIALANQGPLRGNEVSRCAKPPAEDRRRARDRPARPAYSTGERPRPPTPYAALAELTGPHP